MQWREERERGEAEFEQLEYVPDNVMARCFPVRDKRCCYKVTFSASAALGFFFFLPCINLLTPCSSTVYKCVYCIYNTQRHRRALVFLSDCLCREPLSVSDRKRQSRSYPPSQ